MGLLPGSGNITKTSFGRGGGYSGSFVFYEIHTPKGKFERSAQGRKTKGVSHDAYKDLARPKCSHSGLTDCRPICLWRRDH